MGHWKIGIAMVIVLLFSGCGIFLRNRKTNHAGLERYDYDLPVILYPSAEPNSKKMVFILSGDGGWLDFEDELASQFSEKGFHTIGFNSRNYFWNQRSPEELTKDFLLLLRSYRRKYKATEIYICGYSFGADVLPFIYNRLPFRAKRRVMSLQMLSPFASTAFKVHTSDLLNLAGDDKAYKVAPEVEKIKIPIYCYYGIDENPKPLHELQLKNFKIQLLPGDHQYEFPASQTIVSQALKSLP
ncbi:AcvB/VirJ family lysyl-phosphatidylglycerol hydrolase [Pedobacter caeni]|uniref:Virulence protein (VirJ) n=1 Tax=Pedobacter caeni TaxID=288992 RepID=A0A1M5L6Q8_9SPHI|nr:AcvB/VirJ family lysyl-phosphatidylglycerol hydrolase [Pedobacter caeni]SHG60792.1 virulence protein (VirJ) [Pedobacter caeni]